MDFTIRIQVFEANIQYFTFNYLFSTIIVVLFQHQV